MTPKLGGRILIFRSTELLPRDLWPLNLACGALIADLQPRLQLNVIVFNKVLTKNDFTAVE